MCKLRKSSSHKWNINRIYNEQLHYKLLAAVTDFKNYNLDLIKLGRSRERKWNTQTAAYYPVFLLKIQYAVILLKIAKKQW